MNRAGEAGFLECLLVLAVNHPLDPVLRLLEDKLLTFSSPEETFRVNVDQINLSLVCLLDSLRSFYVVFLMAFL